MRKAFFLEGKRSSGAAALAPVLLPLPPTDPLGSLASPWAGMEGQWVPSPPVLSGKCVPGHGQVLHAQTAFAMLWTLSTLCGQWVPGRGTSWELNCPCLHLVAGGNSLTRST